MALRKGKLAFSTNYKGETLPATLTEVLYVPGVARNLFSTTRVLRKGFSIFMEPEGCLIKDPEGNVMAYEIHHGDLTELHNEARPAQALLTEAEIWHRKTGHPSDERLEIISRNSMGMPQLTNVHVSCNACSQGKQVRKLISKGPTEEVKASLAQVHGDLLGPLPVTLLGGAKYVNAIINAKTRHT